MLRPTLCLGTVGGSHRFCRESRAMSQAELDLKPSWTLAAKTHPSFLLSVSSLTALGLRFLTY